jgi:HSP20 family protein
VAIIRREPASELRTIHQEFNRLFGSLFDSQAGAGRAVARRRVPAIDVVEDGAHYVLRADLPGVSESDVKVEVEDDVLTVSGERSSEQRSEADGYRRYERAHGRFSRALRLPEGVDPEGVQAQFENGVLEVRIPKPEQRKPHRVEIGIAKGEPALDQAEAA